MFRNFYVDDFLKGLEPKDKYLLINETHSMLVIYLGILLGKYSKYGPVLKLK